MLSRRQRRVLAVVLFTFIYLSCVSATNDSTVWFCPMQCRCNFLHRTTSCANASLTAMPSNLAHNLEFLDLRWNRLEQVTDVDLFQYRQLKTLDMGWNHVASVSRGAFAFNNRLETLQLCGNHLGWSSVPFFIPASLLELLLSDNNIRRTYLERLLNDNTINTPLALQVIDVGSNELSSLPANAFTTLRFPNLTTVDLSLNRLVSFSLESLASDAARLAPGGISDDQARYGVIRVLNISHNRIAVITGGDSVLLTNLQVLDASNNQLRSLDTRWFLSTPNLLELNLSRNPFTFIPDRAFSAMPLLRSLHFDNILDLTHIRETAFAGLSELRDLSLSGSRRLVSIHPSALRDLFQLRYINLQQCDRLIFAMPSILDTLISSPLFQLVSFNHTTWPCDCRIVPVRTSLIQLLAENRLTAVPTCSGPAEFDGRSVLDVELDAYECRLPMIVNRQDLVSFKLKSSAVIECTVTGSPQPVIVWSMNGHDIGSIVTGGFVGGGAMVDGYMNTTEMNVSLRTIDTLVSSGNVNSTATSIYLGTTILIDGSLFIPYVTTRHAGTYQCSASNEFGNDTCIVVVRLDYAVIATVAVESIMIGFSCAAAMFLIAVVIGALRYTCRVCSSKERRKRKSIREVLEGLQDYKSTQLDRFSAYRTAKWDRLSAFKSATVDQVAKFGHRRIDKLRTYKQATVSNILYHMDRTREHYVVQTARIKENCAVQVERLKESYGVRRGRFKNYRSQHMEKLRDNYNSQVLKIREYSVMQTARLREQYKAQQQHVMKLLELLDVGHCAAVIEAECMRTESMIFDADIATFDFEAESMHATRRRDSADTNDSADNSDTSSRYQTATDSPPPPPRTKRALGMSPRKIAARQQDDQQRTGSGEGACANQESDSSIDESTILSTCAEIVQRGGGGDSSGAAGSNESPTWDSLEDDDDYFPDIIPVELIDPPSLTDSLGFGSNSGDRGNLLPQALRPLAPLVNGLGFGSPSKERTVLSQITRPPNLSIADQMLLPSTSGKPLPSGRPLPPDKLVSPNSKLFQPMVAETSL